MRGVAVRGLVLGTAAMVAALVASACSAPTVATSTATPPRPRTYVALGASDAVGVGTRDPDREGWVPRLAASLGPGVRTINLGVSGSTLSQALLEQLPPALDLHPDLVTVWLVVNDLNNRVTLEQYDADLDVLLGQLRGTGAQVYLGNVPDLGNVGAYTGVEPAALRAEIQRWNAAIAATAERHGVRVVDLYAHWREVADHPEYVSGDGFHPSAEGYARLAELFGDAIRADTDTHPAG